MAARKRLTLSKVKARSAITNGRDILRDIDGRSIVARRYRDIYHQITEDMGGADRMTEVALQLSRRFASASVILEGMETDLANGKQIDVGDFSLLTGVLSRLASRLGIGRKMRDVTPSLSEYLASKNGTQRPRPRARVIDGEVDE
jgi:hypothetical protein